MTMAVHGVTEVQGSHVYKSPREGDVFTFRYSSEAIEKARTGFGRGDLSWCFDGQLIVDHHGRLVDTYWGTGDGRVFENRAAAESQGTLTFVCNLADVDVVPEYKTRRFDPADVFDLTSHKVHRKKFCVRKGAVPNQAVMLAAIDAKLVRVADEFDTATRRAKWDTENLKKQRQAVADGDLSQELGWS